MIAIDAVQFLSTIVSLHPHTACYARYTTAWSRCGWKQ